MDVQLPHSSTLNAITRPIHVGFPVGVFERRRAGLIRDSNGRSSRRSRRTTPLLFSCAPGNEFCNYLGTDRPSILCQLGGSPSLLLPGICTVGTSWEGDGLRVCIPIQPTICTWMQWVLTYCLPLRLGKWDWDMVIAHLRSSEMSVQPPKPAEFRF